MDYLCEVWGCKVHGCFHMLGPAHFGRMVSRSYAEEYWAEYLGRDLDPETEGVYPPSGARVQEEACR